MHNSVLYNDMKTILVTEEEIDRIVTRIAAEIDRDYAHMEGKLLLLGILKGSVVFMGDLMKKINTPVEIDFMKVSSYGNATHTSGRLSIKLDIDRHDLSESNIIIVEDIVDSGRTLSYLTEHLKRNGARSVRVATMLDKQCRDPEFKDFKADYTGAVIPNEFVVGYGLDYAEKYRALPYVGILKPEVYTK